MHSCGFDSIPYDLGVLYTVGQMPDGVPLKVQGFVRTNGRISGGTFHSAVEILSHVRQAASVARERRKLEGDPVGRAVHGVSGRPHNVPSAGGWVAPFPTIDPQHVLRSARALDSYGPDFTYEHYLVVKRLPMVGALAVGAGLGVALTQLGPTRNLLLKLKDPGEGPTPEQRAKGWFNLRFEARGRRQAARDRGLGRRPGYGETSKMLGESALCLARDELPRARRPADARGCDGPGADRPARGGRDQVRGRRGLALAVSAQQAIDVVNSVFGRHPGFRALHAKGVVCAGDLHADRRRRPLTRAAHMQGPEVPVTARFSNASGNPEHPDWAPDPRGLAVKFYLPDGSRTDIVAVSSPRFPTRTPEGFIELVEAQAAGVAAAWKVPRGCCTTPRRPVCCRSSRRHWRRRRATRRSRTTRCMRSSGPISDGGERFVRYTLAPAAPGRKLAPWTARSRGRDYLQDEIRSRVERGPVEFSLEVQIAEPGDPVDRSERGVAARRAGG